MGTRKRNGSAKARLCVEGQKQILGRDYFENKNYCTLLSRRDIRIHSAIATAEGFSVYQTEVVQAFLYEKLDEYLDIYMKPPVRFPCPEKHVLMLQRASYGLYQDPVEFKQEFIFSFKNKGYQATSPGETIWKKAQGKEN